MSKFAWRVIKVTAVVLFSLLLGMVVGVWANANFAERIQFNAVPGYESTGSIGLIFVSIILLFISAYYWAKGKNTK